MQRAFATATKKSLKMISVGAKIPAGTLFENSPGGAVQTAEVSPLP